MIQKKFMATVGLAAFFAFSAVTFASETQWKCYANSGCRTPGGAYWGHYGGSGIAETRADAVAIAKSQARSNCASSCGYIPHYGQGECVDAGSGNCTPVQVLEWDGFGASESR